MSLHYQAVGWNRQKRIYDTVVSCGVALYVASFVVLGLLLRPRITVETLLIRAFGTAALALLHTVLFIGPLARIDRRLLPLLYNRRHLGVITFGLAALHGAAALFQFHALGDVNPLVSVLTANTRFDSLAQFPFQPLGLLALMILFLMAATSHDFWLSQLTAPVWKALHMLVYVAYGLVVLHVVLGVLQAETSPLLVALLGLGFSALVLLHLVAGFREVPGDRETVTPTTDGFVAVCDVEEIPEGRARIACLSGERVAVFRNAGKLSAVSNVCQHQNGPLGEGRIVDGCITCPWHGYQYVPETGASPPPFTERIPTFHVRVDAGRVWVHPRPEPPGTRVEPARIDPETPSPAAAAAFYVGYRDRAPSSVGSRVRAVAAAWLAALPVLAAVLAGAQQPFARGAFELGHPRRFEGIVVETPFPQLLVPRPASPTFSAYPLTVFGKHGAAGAVRGLGGHYARLEGTLIHRDGQTMIQIEDGRVEMVAVAGGTDPGEPEADYGMVTLAGEIVDSKCFLGVMKPGRSKPHRACAARCIRGGVPPVLRVEDADGRVGTYFLVSKSGGPVHDQVIDFVAEPVQITGRLVGRGGLLFLQADVSTYRRR